MNDQASKLRELAATTKFEQDHNQPKVARFIAVTSGKGGVGKSMVTANLAIALSRLKKRVIVIDADFGTANQHILFDTYGRFNLSHVLDSKAKIEECCVRHRSGVLIVSGGSGISKLADLSAKQRFVLIDEFQKLKHAADYILFDTGAGISRNVTNVALAADEVIVVTTPEPTAITDAYAMVKTISNGDSAKVIKLIMNMANNKLEAEKIASKISAVSRQFLNLYIERVGVVLRDDIVMRSVREKRLLMQAYPNSRPAQSIQHIAASLVRSTSISQSSENTSNFWTKLSERFNMAA